MEINCSIIEDLLPRYIDGSCSDESKKLIENHLNTCQHCQYLYANMKCNEMDTVEKNFDALKKIKINRRFLVCFFFVFVLILLLLFSQIQGILAKALMYHHFHKIDNANDYSVSTITYHEDNDSSSEFYVMSLAGEGEDDNFKIVWEPFHKIEDNYEDISNGENMVFRLTSSFQEELEIVTKNMLPNGHRVAIGGLLTTQTKEYLINHYENNIDYDKFLFKEVPLTFGLHVDDTISIDTAIEEAKLIQEYFDKLGFNIEIYNITFESRNGNWESFENLKREDLTTSLSARLTKIKNGETDESIIYSTN